MEQSSALHKRRLFTAIEEERLECPLHENDSVKLFPLGLVNVHHQHPLGFLFGGDQAILIEHLLHWYSSAGVAARSNPGRIVRAR